MTELIVTHADMRAMGYCNRGARRWIAARGLDWSRFVREGLPIEVIEASEDAMALRVAEAVRGRR